MKYDFLLSDKCRYVAQLLIAAYRQKKGYSGISLAYVNGAGVRISNR